MPEFTLKQLMAQLEAMGFDCERQGNGHYKVRHNGTVIAGFCEAHGSRTKRGMVRECHYRNTLRDCQRYLDAL